MATIFSKQLALFLAAVFTYFAVRGVTEGGEGVANRNADRLLTLEQRLGVDFEERLQEALLDNQWIVDVANWIYIWLHWPVIGATLVWLVARHRDVFFELRNAIFISGFIGFFIFAFFPVAPPRLFGVEYVDTVTEHSSAYRVLQPPGLVNKFAALPSLHFGWNLLIGIAWYNASRTRRTLVAAILMPVGMAFAVVATANHWTLDVLAGGVVALTGLALERARQHVLESRRERQASSLGDVIGRRKRSRPMGESAPTRGACPVSDRAPRTASTCTHLYKS
ncbi:MAG: phosphatase PAP2 family protein [Acidimicrobiales bacterium]